MFVGSLKLTSAIYHSDIKIKACTEQIPRWKLLQPVIMKLIDVVN